MYIQPTWSGLGTFCSFGSATHSKNIGRIADRFLRTFATTFQSELDKTLHQFGELYSGSFPKIEAERPRYGIDFINIDVAVVVIHNNINSAHSVATQNSESLAGKMTDSVADGFREVCRDAFRTCLHTFCSFMAAHIFVFIGSSQTEVT